MLKKSTECKMEHYEIQRKTITHGRQSCFGTVLVFVQCSWYLMENKVVFKPSQWIGEKSSQEGIIKKNGDWAGRKQIWGKQAHKTET